MNSLAWMYILLYLRLVSIAVLVGAFAWVLMSAPPGRYRAIRLILTIFLISLNIVSISISVLVFKVFPL